MSEYIEKKKISVFNTHFQQKSTGFQQNRTGFNQKSVEIEKKVLKTMDLGVSA